MLTPQRKDKFGDSGSELKGIVVVSFLIGEKCFKDANVIY
jgi:hypothetical protein